MDDADLHRMIYPIEDFEILFDHVVDLNYVRTDLDKNVVAFQEVCRACLVVEPFLVDQTEMKD